MNMARPLTVSAAAALLTLVLTSGCNAILGNEEGRVRAAQAGSGADGDAAPVEAATDGGGTAEAAPPPDGGISCNDGKKLCAQYQACIDKDDVNFGCGSAECAACDTTNASAVACVPGATAIECKPTCNAGWKDCDGKGGCETDLSKSESCGDCGVACGAGSPLCAKQLNGNYACVSSCPAGQQQCSGSTKCVDVQTDPSHCGACNSAPCPTVANGRAICSGGQCAIECNVLFHKCGDACVPDSSATQCGPACTNCTAQSPANATGGICENGTCAWTACAYGWDDCNKDLGKGLAGDGCETDVLYDYFNCGGCGNACGGGVIPTYLGRSYIPPPTDGEQCCEGKCQSTQYACLSVR